jgi:multidrug efflux pump
MTLPELCIKRPVFATVLSLGVLLIGLISYQRLSIREYPKIDEPVVSVETVYKGASPEVIESQVTKPLEDSLSGIEGVDVITSQSRSERSQINVRFRITVNPDTAAAEVRDKVARARGKLPDAAEDPIISKVEADASPVIFTATVSSKHSQLEITDYLNRFIKPRIQVLPGAADVRIFGERRPSMRIWLDAGKLAAFKLTTQDVEDALRRQNLEVPAGRIESRNREFSVLAQTDLQTPEQFAAIVIKDASGYPVRLGDVARTEIGAADERGLQRFNGVTSVGMGVIKQATANPLELSVALRKEAVEIRKTLPEGMEFIITYDSSQFIQQSIKAVFGTIAEAVLLVSIVIFLFLRNLRATIIPLVTIPVSLIGAFALMYAFGFTVNTLTLLAMVLAVGLVVDDAIVVLENIYRHIEEGMPRMEASLLGAREIAFAVLAMTITLAAVYAPLAFATGRTGRLFIEFALALAGAVTVSGFVALTLSPMMCSKLLKHETKHGAVYNAIERFFNTMTDRYRSSLVFALKHRLTVVLSACGVAALSVVLFLSIRSELAPTEDRGVIFGIVSAPEGSTLAYTDQYLRQIEGFYMAMVPERAAIFANGGSPTVADGRVVVRLKPWEERTRKQQEISRELQPKFQSLPGVNAFPSNPPSLGQNPFEKPLQFVLLTQASFADLQRMVDRLMAEAAKNPGLLALDTDLKLNQPELKVSLNRDKVADVGANVESVGRTLETMLGGRQVTRFKRDGEQYDVLVQIAPDQRDTPDRISDLYVRGKNGEMIQLSNLLGVRESVSPKNLNHFNRLRSATITANLAPGYTLGEAITFMQETAKQTLPATVQTDLAPGQSRELRDSSSDIYLVFVLALAFIYLVLSAQFESFIDPFVIMLTVPLSMTGALAALWLSGGTLNVYSQIGLITLVGLITKHGILIVEFSNQMQERGLAKTEAVIEAAVLRLRPILMTTGAMVLGAIPLALARGAGSESRQTIGWVIVGGLLLGTVLTLFVVPTAYTLLASSRNREKSKQSAGDLPIPAAQHGDD